MAYIRKTRGMLRMEQAYGISDIRTLLLTSYARHNTIKAVAREFKVSEQTMSAWFRQLGLHTRSSLPAMAIPQDLSMQSVTTDSGWGGDFEDDLLDASEAEGDLRLRPAHRLEGPAKGAGGDTGEGANDVLTGAAGAAQAPSANDTDDVDDGYDIPF